MKRSSALAPLSRDHHMALVVARDLVRARGEAQAAAAADRYVQFLDEHELGHFELEETVLLPAVPPEEPGPSLTEQVLSDHGWLRDALRRLRDASAARDVDRVHEAGERLRAHVRLEEQQLFPYIEDALSADALARVGARLAERGA